MTWLQVPLRDLVAEPLRNGRSVKDGSGGFPVLRLTALGGTWADLDQAKDGDWTREDALPFLVRAGDFLVSRGNGSLRRVAKGSLVAGAPSEVAFPDTMIRVRPRVDHLDPKFLAYVWSAPATRAQIESKARTTAGIYKVAQRDLSVVTLPVPPVAEQRRIVEILEDHLSHLDAAAAYQAAALRRAWSLREELVRRAITGADVSADRRMPDLADVGTQDGELAPLPEGWTWRRLGDIAEVVGGVTKDSGKQSRPGMVEVPYLRVANVQRGALRLDRVTTIRVPPEKALALKLQTGDVLLNEGGDRDKLARGWVWEDQVQDCIHQNHVFRARLKVDLDPYFLSWTANTFGGRWADRNGKQSVNLASISLSMIRKMPVIVPPVGTSSGVVAELGARLEDVGRLENAVHESEARTVALRRGVLAAAFEGKLTGRHTDAEVIEELAET